MATRERTQTVLLAIIAFVLIALVLYQAKAIFIPVVLAGFLGVLLTPALRWLGKYLPGWLAMVVLLLAIGLLVAAASALILVNVEAIAAKATFYSQRFNAIFERAIELLGNLGIDTSTLEGSAILGRALNFLTGSLESAASAFGQMGLVFFLLVFLLLEVPQLRQKLATAFSPDQRDQVVDSLGKIAGRIQRYMVTKTLISLGTAVLSGIILYAIGIDFAFLWGFLTFLLNYIPNVGSIIAVTPPVLIGLLQYDSPTRALVALGSLVTVQMVLGNVIEPRLMGRSLNLSPLVVLLSMLLWGWLWGLIGVVLAVPLTATIQIVCSSIESLRPVAVLLGDSRNVTS